MIFKNREEAALKLAKALEDYKNLNALVIGIPRGAISMAKIIADELNGELGAILVHKIPMPGNEEFAIGSIGLSGHIHLMPYFNTLHLPESYVEEAANEQLKILKQRLKKYGMKAPNFEDRIVIIVDDGIATGATTLSAIYEVQSQHPRKIIIAASVASEESITKIQSVVDEVVILQVPDFFFAVGQFFEDFRQVSDEEVIEIFEEFRKK